MLERMNDSSHDEQHVYRVLYAALDGSGDEGPSFFKEYHFKLKNVYGKVDETHRIGMRRLEEALVV
jgi:hypothetical protein